MEKEKQIKIIKVNLRYAWRWKTNTEICLICQQDFYSNCESCKHPIDCVPVQGKCSHTFHLHCINRWVDSNKFCPMCRQKWKKEKNI